jgi:hypothetical protein
MARWSRLSDGARVARSQHPVKIARNKATVVALSSARLTHAPAETLPLLEFARVVEVGEAKILVEVARLGAQPQLANSLVGFTEFEAGDQVVVALVGKEGSNLVVLGRLFNPTAPARDVRVNGRRISIEADSELVLKCASATIRIGCDGLVAVRGDRVTTQARASNRIRGGSVEIN